MFAVGAHDGSRVVAEISRPFVSLGKWISRFTRAFCLAPHHTWKPCICINSGALITFKHLKKQRVFQQKWNWRLLSNFVLKPLNCLNQFSFSSIVQSTLFCPSMPDLWVKSWNEFNFSAWCLRKGKFRTALLGAWIQCVHFPLDGSCIGCESFLSSCNYRPVWWDHAASRMHLLKLRGRQQTQSSPLALIVNIEFLISVRFIRKKKQRKKIMIKSTFV